MGSNKAEITIIAENFLRLKYLSLIFVGYAVFVLFSDFGPFQVWNPTFLGIYKFLDITFAILAVISVLFFWLYKGDNSRLQDLGIKFGLMWILIWSAIVSGIELTAMGYSALTLLLLVAALFIYNNLITAIIYASTSYVGLIVTLYLQHQLNQSVLPHLLIILPIAVIATIVSARNYNNKISELINKNKLIDLNYELQTIKENLEEEVKRRTTELSEAKEKAEESDRLKSAFLANMSHEIRTPMNGILGFAELLKEPGLTGEQQHQYVSIIEKGGERMLNIINNLIDISKIESGLMELSYSETNINQQVEYIHSFFYQEAAKKGIDLNISSLLPEEVPLVITDREKLLAILTNLVKNAIKYCDKGSIDIGCSLKNREEYIGQSANITTSQVILFQVKDSGIGIPQNRTEAIFERFIQADIVDSEARQGAGLGLSITKSYVEMLGGTIWVESKQALVSGEGGTSFFCIIPYLPNGQAIGGVNTNKAQQTILTNLKKPKILIAEDDDTSSLFLQLVLKKSAGQILIAKTGREAIEICQTNPDLDLILMDIRLPDFNGYEATRQIREFNPRVTIFAQTAFALSGDKEKAIEAGCNDYLTKPIQETTLKEMMLKHLSK